MPDTLKDLLTRYLGTGWAPTSHLALVQNPDMTSESAHRMNRPVEVS